MRGRRGAWRLAGASAIEFAIVLPVLLMLGLGALQWALVFHARHSIEHAAIEAARAGSVGHALPESIERGLARGLLPLWASWAGIREAGPDRERAVDAALGRVRQAFSDGWIVLRRLEPVAPAFADWGEASIDDWGRPIPGTREIPNDNLAFAEQRAPDGGAAGTRAGLPVGPRSGQTLVEANRLRVELVYGVPMTVPFVGRIAVAAARLVGGCMPAELGGCRIHEARDAHSRPASAVARWPVRVTAMIRMQSAARVPGQASAGVLPPMSSPAGPGSAVPAPDSGFAPPEPVVVGVPAQVSTAPARQPSLSFGADRLFSVPGACAGA